MESESRDHQHQAEVCAGTYQSDYTFKEEDVPGLAEALAEAAYKWEQMAVALRLPQTAIEECREKGSDLALKFYNMLYTWVVHQHANAAQATRENLKTALASPLVQYPQLARELDGKLKTSLSLHTQATLQEKSIYRSRVREVLVERYSQYPEVPRGFWPPVVSKRFINLALIETSGQPRKSDYSIRGDADDVLAKKTPVKYKDVFKVYKRQKQLLILGRPGSGKTTLVHKLVRDWSEGKVLQGAELVFLVSLRMLNSKKCDLPQLLSKYFLNKDHVKQIFDTMDRTKGNRVCFIFDGFDEYCPPKKKKSVIFSLFEKKILVDAMIIVTSRPAAAQVLNYSFNKIEVFGFSKSQIQEYIKTFPFSSLSSVNEAHSQKLQSFLSFHPGVLDLCYLPVNCAIICFMYGTGSNVLPDTQTQIYALFTRLIIIRQLTSRDKYRQLDSLEGLKGQEAEDFKKLCSLAFDMTTQSQQVITKGPASSDEAHSLGLVTTDIIAELSGYKNRYSFLHLTLQEFLAAYHLSKLNQEEQMSLIEKYGKTVHMLTVWKLYFGLVSFETGLHRAEKLFNNFEHNDLYRVQCSYEAQQSCINELVSSREFKFHETLSNYDFSALAYVVSSAASAGSQATPMDTLTFLSWAPESGKLRVLIDQLSDEALGFIVNLGLYSYPHFSITDMESLAHMLKVNRIRQTEEQGLKCLENLTLHDCGIRDENVAVLATGLDGIHVLQCLDLSNNLLSATTVVSELMKINCHLKNLNLSSNRINDEDAALLATGLDGNHVLESLRLSYNYIGAITGVSELVKADCHLKVLDLSTNDIGDDGAIAVAEGLRNNNFLKSIDLSSNKIGAAGIGSLALVLQGTIYLNLTRNKFTFDSALADTVTSHDTVTSDCCSNFPETTNSTTENAESRDITHNCTLEKLDLSDNICNGNPVTTISKFKSLSHIDLSHKELGLQGAKAMVDYAVTSDNCQQLKYLGMREDTFISFSTENNIEGLKQLLSSSFGFIVDLSGNDIDETRVLSILKTLNHHDRDGGVYFEFNIGHHVNIDEEIIADLTEAFRHDHINRLLVANGNGLYLTLKSSARSNASNLPSLEPPTPECCSIL